MINLLEDLRNLHDFIHRTYIHHLTRTSPQELSIQQQLFVSDVYRFPKIIRLRRQDALD